MFRQLPDLTKAATFCGITFALALLVALLPLGEGGDLAQMLSMFIPSVAALLMLLVVTRDGRERAAWRALGLVRAGRRAWTAALLVPALILAVSYALLWGTDIATFNGPDTGAADLAISTAINFAIVLVFALAEEIGWRGYLLPRLRPLSERAASLLTGLLHSLFHLPLLLLTPFYHGAGDRLIVVPLFLLALSLAGPFYGYLRLTTGSVWPAAIAHNALNATWGLFTGRRRVPGRRERPPAAAGLRRRHILVPRAARRPIAGQGAISGGVGPGRRGAGAVSATRGDPGGRGKGGQGDVVRDPGAGTPQWPLVRLVRWAGDRRRPRRRGGAHRASRRPGRPPRTPGEDPRPGLAADRRQPARRGARAHSRHLTRDSAPLAPRDLAVVNNRSRIARPIPAHIPTLG
jgi:uncharacterized protein